MKQEEAPTNIYIRQKGAISFLTATEAIQLSENLGNLKNNLELSDAPRNVKLLNNGLGKLIEKLTHFNLENGENVLKSNNIFKRLNTLVLQAIKILKPLINSWINTRKKRAIDLDRDLLLEMTIHDRKLVREMALNIGTLLSDQTTDKQDAADEIYKKVDKIRDVRTLDIFEGQMPYYTPGQSRQTIKKRLIRWLRELNLVPTYFRDYDLRQRVIDTDLDTETTVLDLETTTTTSTPLNPLNTITDTPRTRNRINFLNLGDNDETLDLNEENRDIIYQVDSLESTGDIMETVFIAKGSKMDDIQNYESFQSEDATERTQIVLDFIKKSINPNTCEFYVKKDRDNNLNENNDYIKASNINELEKDLFANTVQSTLASLLEECNNKLVVENQGIKEIKEQMVKLNKLIMENNKAIRLTLGKTDFDKVFSGQLFEKIALEPTSGITHDDIRQGLINKAINKLTKSISDYERRSKFTHGFMQTITQGMDDLNEAMNSWNDKVVEIQDKQSSLDNLKRSLEESQGTLDTTWHTLFNELKEQLEKTETDLKKEVEDLRTKRQINTNKVPTIQTNDQGYSEKFEKQQWLIFENWFYVLAKEFDEVFKTEEKLSNPLKQNAFPVLDLLEKVTDFKDIIAIEGTLDGTFYIFSNPIVMYRNIPVDIYMNSIEFSLNKSQNYGYYETQDDDEKMRKGCGETKLFRDFLYCEQFITSNQICEFAHISTKSDSCNFVASHKTISLETTHTYLDDNNVFIIETEYSTKKENINETNLVSCHKFFLPKDTLLHEADKLQLSTMRWTLDMVHRLVKSHDGFITFSIALTVFHLTILVLYISRCTYKQCKKFYEGLKESEPDRVVRFDLGEGEIDQFL